MAHRPEARHLHHPHPAASQTAAAAGSSFEGSVLGLLADLQEQVQGRDVHHAQRRRKQQQQGGPGQHHHLRRLAPLFADTLPLHTAELAAREAQQGDVKTRAEQLYHRRPGPQAATEEVEGGDGGDAAEPRGAADAIVVVVFELRQARRYELANRLEALLEALDAGEGATGDMLRLLLALQGHGAGAAGRQPMDVAYTARVAAGAEDSSASGHQPLPLSAGGAGAGGVAVFPMESNLFGDGTDAIQLSARASALRPARRAMFQQYSPEVFEGRRVLPLPALDPQHVQESKAAAFAGDLEPTGPLWSGFDNDLAKGSSLFGALTLQRARGIPAPPSVFRLPDTLVQPGATLAKQLAAHRQQTQDQTARTLPDAATHSDDERDTTEQQPDLWLCPAVCREADQQRLPAPAWDKERPGRLLSEAGVEAFELANRVFVSRLDPSQRLRDPLPACAAPSLVQPALHCLLGVPSAVFSLDRAACTLVAANVRIAGTTALSTRNLLKFFEAHGSSFLQLERYVATFGAADLPGGRTSGALANGLRTYLQRYRMQILSFSPGRLSKAAAPTLLGLRARLAGVCAQMQRVLAVLSLTDPKGTGGGGSRERAAQPQQPFVVRMQRAPVGAPLVSALYTFARRAQFSEDGPLAFALLKAASEPLFKFLQEWAWDGVCSDPFGEFGIRMVAKEVAERNARYWTRGFVDEHSVAMTTILGEAADVLFLSGKSMHFLRKCNPGHFVCSTAIPQPTLALTFSRAGLDAAERQHFAYKGAVAALARQQHAEREGRRRAAEERRLEKRRQVTALAILAHEARQRAAQRRADALRAQKERQRRALAANLADHDEGQRREQQRLDEEEARRQEYHRQQEERVQAEMAALQAQYLAIELEASEREAREAWLARRAGNRDALRTLLEAENAQYFQELAAPVQPADSGPPTGAGRLAIAPALQPQAPGVDGATGPTTPQGVLAALRRRLEAVKGRQQQGERQDAGAAKEHGPVPAPARAAEDQQPADPVDHAPTHEEAGMPAKEPAAPIPTPAHPPPGEYRPPQHEAEVQSDGYPAGYDGIFGWEEDPWRRLGDQMALSPLTSAPHLAKAAMARGTRRRLLAEEVGSGLLADEEPEAGEDDVASGPPMAPLAAMIRRAVTDPLLSHAAVINQGVVQYLLEDLGLMDHLEGLRRYVLMHCGEFANSLTDLLCSALHTGATPLQLASTALLRRAIDASLQDGDARTENLTFVFAFSPKSPFEPTSIHALDFLNLTYSVPWPLDIVIDASHQASYSKIFTLLMKLKQSAWHLHACWVDLTEDFRRFRTNTHAMCRLRQVQCFRNEMQHFVSVTAGYFSHEVLHVCWQDFVRELGRAPHLDAIREAHSRFLSTVMQRCMLNRRAEAVMHIVDGILGSVVRFCTQMRLNQNAWETPRVFAALVASHAAFQKSSRFLFTVATNLAAASYEPHLQDLLLHLNYNGFFGRGLDSRPAPQPLATAAARNAGSRVALHADTAHR